jgi:hypothetical protein
MQSDRAPSWNGPDARAELTGLSPSHRDLVTHYIRAATDVLPRFNPAALAELEGCDCDLTANVELVIPKVVAIEHTARVIYELAISTQNVLATCELTRSFSGEQTTQSLTPRMDALQTHADGLKTGGAEGND